MKRVYFVSLGCPKNLVDSEILSALLYEADFEIVENPEEAEIFLISTCAFIKPAIEESIEVILELAQKKHSGKKLVVIGCLVERYREKLISLFPEVDAWFGLKSLATLPKWLKQPFLPHLLLGGSGWQQEHYLKRIPSNPFTAYVKIAEGCSNQCTFCTIPTIRGRLKSRTIEDIYEEVKLLVAQGIKEVILVAQETTAYGIDIYGRPCLSKLIQQLEKTDATWLRILYAHPRRALPLIEAFSSCEHLTPYLDIPIQHIDTQVLKAMGRGMTQKEIRQTLVQLRKELPEVKLRTTIMVGFPNETQAAFKKLLSFLKEIEFDHLGVFKYSPEEGTQAFKWEDRVPEGMKEQRYQEVMELQKQIVRKKHRNYIDKEQPVFIEKLEEDCVGMGRTPWQAPEIDGQVYITKGAFSLGEIKKVKITDANDYDLIGVID